MPTKAENAKKSSFYRLRCSDAVMQTFRQFSVALQPRDAKGQILEGPAGRVFCRIKITDGPFRVFDEQGLNPRPFQLIQGPLPPEISAAVRSGRILAEPAEDTARIAQGDIFDPQAAAEEHLKPEHSQEHSQ